MSPTDREIAHTIHALLAARAPGRTICPSEVARAVAPTGWRPLMPAVRRVARELAGRGEVELRQRGSVIPPNEEPRGPIRLAAVNDAIATPLAR
jgi:hypothetical protein